MKKNAIFLSKSLNPFLNLAFEDWLLRSNSQYENILYLWRNTPCVVIGRNQIPWLECNVVECARRAIPVIRRYSGGGAVYHDTGNALYSALGPKETFSRTTYGQLISTAFKNMRIPVEVNERHDLVVGELKVSGSAFRITKDRAYHHGTMLLNSQLEDLRGLLTPHPSIRIDSVVSASVRSIRSPVTNLNITHEEYAAIMIEMFQARHRQSITPIAMSEDQMMAVEGIREGLVQLRSRQWTFGKGPGFKAVLPDGSWAIVEDGIIRKAENASLENSDFYQLIMQKFNTNVQ